MIHGRFKSLVIGLRLIVRGRSYELNTYPHKIHIIHWCRRLLSNNLYVVDSCSVNVDDPELTLIRTSSKTYILKTTPANNTTQMFDLETPYSQVIYFGHFWSKNKSEPSKIPEVNLLFHTLYIQLDNFAWWIFTITRSIVGNYIAFWVDFNSGQCNGCQARRMHWERVFTLFIDYNERSTIADACVHAPYFIAPWWQLNNK